MSQKVVQLPSVEDVKREIQANQPFVKRVTLSPIFAAYLAESFTGGGCEGGVCKEHPAQALLKVPVSVRGSQREHYLIEVWE